MNITTTHTLRFDMACVGDDVQRAAVQVIKSGADCCGVTATIGAKPLPDGSSPDMRFSAVTITSEEKLTLEAYWARATSALEFIGVEVSP